MSEDQGDAAELAGQEPLFVQPSAADSKPRVVKPAELKAVPVDPEAPFGYTRDAATGEMRPKKAPGRGPGKSTPRTATPPPANRKANTPRTISAEKATEPKRSHGAMVGDLVDSLWMVTAAIPLAPPGAKMGGVDVHDLTVKAKGQGAILREQRPAIVQGMSAMAEHSEPVRRGIEFLAADNGPGWILPACMLLAPFVLQSQAMWRGAAEAAVPLAERTQREFAALMEAMGGGQIGDGDQAAAPTLTLVRTDG